MFYFSCVRALADAGLPKELAQHLLPPDQLKNESTQEKVMQVFRERVADERMRVQEYLIQLDRADSTLRDLQANQQPTPLPRMDLKGLNGRSSNSHGGGLSLPPYQLKPLPPRIIPIPHEPYTPPSQLKTGPHSDADWEIDSEIEGLGFPHPQALHRVNREESPRPVGINTSDVVSDLPSWMQSPDAAPPDALSLDEVRKLCEQLAFPIRREGEQDPNQ